MTLKKKLSEAPVLVLPSLQQRLHSRDRCFHSRTWGCTSQVQEDGKLRPVACASRALSQQEKNYAITELETLAVAWAITHFHYYLYGHRVTVYTDHAAVKAVLETPNPTGKHASWWTRVYGRGVKEVQIIYRRGRENISTDALSRNPQAPPPEQGIAEGDVQIAAVDTSCTPVSEPISQEAIGTLLKRDPESRPMNFNQVDSFAVEQAKDEQLREILDFLRHGDLPEDAKRARKIAAQAPVFAIVDYSLFFVDARLVHWKRAVVPRHLRKQVLEETHSGPLGGHFLGKRLYKSLVRHWWWEGMYVDAVEFSRNCPECAIVKGGSHQHKPPLYPIPVQCPFQVM